jgi:putative tricarboxylic transport membrane protein
MDDQSRKSGDFWSGLALAALGVYIVAEARQWDYLAPEGPGAGFFPVWYGIAMIVLSVALVVSSVTRRSSKNDEAFNWARARRALAAWVALVICVALLRWLGFVLSYALFVYCVTALMYERPWRSAATIAVTSAAGFWLVFPTALGVALPVGVFGF